jgi:hypothetical protein
VGLIICIRPRRDWFRVVYDRIMIDYQVRREQSIVLYGWAIVAIDQNGHQRFVCRCLPLDQATRMIDRLAAMMAAEREICRKRARMFLAEQSVT